MFWSRSAASVLIVASIVPTRPVAGQVIASQVGVATGATIPTGLSFVLETKCHTPWTGYAAEDIVMGRIPQTRSTREEFMRILLIGATGTVEGTATGQVISP